MSCALCKKDEHYAKVTIQFAGGFVIATICYNCFEKAKTEGVGACPECKTFWFGSKYGHKCPTLN